MDAQKQRRKSRAGLIIPIILVLAAATALVIALTGAWGMTVASERVTEDMVRRLVRLLGYLAAGLLIGQVVESLGWTARMARLVRPLTRWGRLKPESGAAFVSSFVSGIVANTMLMGFYREQKLQRRELILSYLVNNGLPIFLVHLPTTFFIVVSLAGEAGLVYIGITFTAACLRTAGALMLSRSILTDPPRDSPPAEPTYPDDSVTRGVWKKFAARFPRLLVYTIPIYVLVFLVNEWGLFDWLKSMTADRVSGEVFPVEKASVIVFSIAAEFSSGMAAAGALLDAGTLTVKQTAIALIAGTVLSTPIRAIRHQLPTHSGIFTPALALELLTLSQGLRVVSLAVVTIPYAVWY